MKKISIISIVTWLALSIQAQTNPHIASLVDFVYSIEGSNATYLRGYNGTYYENVTIYLQSAPNLLSRSFKYSNDSIAQLDRNRTRLQIQVARPIYDAIRETCHSLARNAENSNMWEYHHNGTDSIKYDIMLREGENISPNNLTINNMGWYPTGFSIIKFPRLNGLEALQYEYIPEFGENPQRYEDGRWPLQGWGLFNYHYTAQEREGIEHFDKKEYSRMIDQLLSNADCTTSRPIHLSHEANCSFSPNLNNMAFFVDSPYERGDYDPQTHRWIKKRGRPQSESLGVLYTTHSKEVADSLLQQIIQITESYLKEHPHIRYEFSPKVRYEDALSTVFTGENGSGAVEDYRIFVHRDQNDEYHILTFDTKGELWIPLTWPDLKSWENGNATYYSPPRSEVALSWYTGSRERVRKKWDTSR